MEHENRYAKRQRALPQGERLSNNDTRSLPACFTIPSIISVSFILVNLLGGHVAANVAGQGIGENGTDARPAAR